MAGPRLGPRSVNLIGDHTDYMGGWAFAMAVHCRTTDVLDHGGRTLRLVSADEPEPAMINLDAPIPRQGAALRALCRRGRGGDPAGCRRARHGDHHPAQSAGLSSSAVPARRSSRPGGDTGSVDARRLAVERGLVHRAVAALTDRALAGLPFEALGPTKGLLKQFFSPKAWGDDEATALADAVGPGDGWWEEPLDDDLVLEFGWIEGRFDLSIQGPGGSGDRPPVGATDALGATFEGDVVPEATPNPRTLVFRLRAVFGAGSREYRSDAEADDSRVGRILTAFPEVVSVMVARDFVAVTVRRPEWWPELLPPVLAVVAEEFSGGDDSLDGASAPAAVPGMAALHRRSAAAGRTRPPTRLDRAWDELGGLRAADPTGLERLVAAAIAPEPAHRQVAAGLLGEAPADLALRVWSGLVGDESRTVRRAAVDAVVDARREELRPILERALGDTDAWVRWKAIRGLTELGAAPSRAVIEPLGDDRDFRVRLEARGALRR